jgi:hypothetical protein
MQLLTFSVIKAIDAVNVLWALRKQGSFAQKRKDIIQVVLSSELVDVFEQSFTRNAN